MSRWRALTGGRAGLLVTIALVALFAIGHVPAALAFPYRAEFGTTTVLSEQPIGPAMGRVLARADRLLAASALYRPGLRRELVLTTGGWRWHVLALTSVGAFGIRRPFSHALIFNRSDVEADAVFNDAPTGNKRTLSGTIAHETTHILVAEHVGEWRMPFFPTWKTEGYSDFVAQESSLSPAEAARVRATNPGAPALAYFDARRRVAAELGRNGGSVDRLFD